MATTLDRPDILVRTTAGAPLAVVEITNPVGLTVERATENRRAYVEHGITAVAPFFLLVSQDVGYLWREPAAVDAPPDVTFPMDDLVRHYFPAGLPGARLLSRSVEAVVYQWFSDLAYLGRSDELKAERALERIGILSTIRRPDVEIDWAE